jgi:hypothetical protein
MKRNHAHTDLRPLGEQVGAAKVAKAEKRVAIVCDFLTLLGLFVSWGSGLEAYVAVCGILLKYMPLSKRLMRKIGDRELPKLKF